MVGNATKDKVVKALAIQFLAVVEEEALEMAPLRRFRMRKRGPQSNSELRSLWQEGEKRDDGFGRKVRMILDKRSEAKEEVIQMVGEKVVESTWKETTYRREGAGTALRRLVVTKETVRYLLEAATEVKLPGEVRHPRPSLAASRLDDLAKKTFDQVLENLRSRSPEDWRSSNSIKVSFTLIRINCFNFNY